MATDEEIKQIVDDMSTALRSLNDALARSHEAGLIVKIDTVSVEEFGIRGRRDIYSAEISKLSFKQRV